MQILNETLGSNRKIIIDELNKAGFDTFTANRLISLVGERIIRATIIGKVDIDAPVAKNATYLMETIKIKMSPMLASVDNETFSMAVKYLINTLLMLLKAKFSSISHQAEYEGLKPLVHEVQSIASLSPSLH